jgi:hypothetical protein
MTIRQLFYRLVSQATIENRLPDYQRVSKAMTKARKDGRVPYEWIVDRSRSSYHNPGWSGLEGLGRVIENTLINYRRDYWQEQPALVEVWCEKDAVTGSIQELCDEFGVRIEPIRGFDSTTKIHEAGERFSDALDSGKNLAILYLGDHDPSGKDIERDLWKRLGDHLPPEVYSTSRRSISRLAIFAGDIKQFKLPPLKVKTKDPRAGGFLKVHGNAAVELDALPPTELRRRIREAIESRIDYEAWNRAMLVEAAQQETCRNYASTIRMLMAKESNEKEEKYT